MKGDFSRPLSIGPQFSGLLMQQGRVQTDADYNEEALRVELKISEHFRDILGYAGAPTSDPNHATAFQITATSSAKFQLGTGRYYVNGRMFYNSNKKLYTIPDPSAGSWHLLYLDTWQQFASAVEAPAILDPALGGADTAGRVENRWQLNSCPLQLTNQQLQDPRNTIAAFQKANWTPPASVATAPTISNARMSVSLADPPPAQENRLYRVEIHTGGAAGTATFKWSRDNGSICAPVTALALKSGVCTITLGPYPGHPVTDFEPDSWVELKAIAGGLRTPGLLVQLTAVQNTELSFTVSSGEQAAVQALQGEVSARAVIARRWDSGAVPILRAGTPLALENGLEVTFSPPSENGTLYFNTGDYWWFNTRAPHLLEWPPPGMSSSAVAPAGVRHAFSPLAGAYWTGSEWEIVDLRRMIVPPGEGFVSKTGPVTMTGPLTISGNLNVNGTIQSGNMRKNKVINEEFSLSPYTESMQGSLVTNKTTSLEFTSLQLSGPVLFLFQGGGFGFDQNCDEGSVCYFGIYAEKTGSTSGQILAKTKYILTQGGSATARTASLYWLETGLTGEYKIQLHYWFQYVGKKDGEKSILLSQNGSTTSFSIIEL